MIWAFACLMLGLAFSIVRGPDIDQQFMPTCPFLLTSPVKTFNRLFDRALYIMLLQDGEFKLRELPEPGNHILQKCTRNLLLAVAV